MYFLCISSHDNVFILVGRIFGVSSSRKGPVKPGIKHRKPIKRIKAKAVSDKNGVR
jgi:hypothetical protein